MRPINAGAAESVPRASHRDTGTLCVLPRGGEYDVTMSAAPITATDHGYRCLYDTRPVVFHIRARLHAHPASQAKRRIGLARAQLKDTPGPCLIPQAS
jgi:hypothetical protein